MTKKFIPAILVLAICAGALPLSGCAKEDETPDFSNAKAIAELSTLEVYSHNVAKLEKPGSWFFDHGYKKTWYEYSGYVTLGVDTTKVVIDQPNAENVVVIHMPQAEVLGKPDVDEGSFTDPITDRGFLTEDFSAQEKAKAFAEAQNQMLKKVSNDDELLSRARTRAKEILKEYVQGIGDELGQDYTVEYKDVD